MFLHTLMNILRYSGTLLDNYWHDIYYSKYSYNFIKSKYFKQDISNTRPVGRIWPAKSVCTARFTLKIK